MAAQGTRAVVRAPAWELGEESSAGSSACCISVVEVSLVYRKNNTHLLSCRENTSWRVCVALWFRGVFLAHPESTAVFRVKKKLVAPLPRPLGYVIYTWFANPVIGVLTDWAAATLPHVPGIAGNWTSAKHSQGPLQLLLLYLYRKGFLVMSKSCWLSIWFSHIFQHK